ncbi:MAG: hypothetical protein GY913_07950 [Proteobacteria bacterium]|nr:hypothetical protein [Pseudomonadota bacterium]MCP4916845.1 hypothetical protein [Pseudomonadota bacterium]
MVLHLDGSRIVGVQGVDLLHMLAPGRPLMGDLGIDLTALVALGVPRHVGRAEAISNLQLLLAGALLDDVEVCLVDGLAPAASVELDRTIFELLSEALPLARPPDAVAWRSRVLMDEPLFTRGPCPYDLDPIAERTYELAARSPTLRQMVLRGGRADPHRSRQCWRAFDLLQHLELIALDTDVSEDNGFWNRGDESCVIPRAPSTALLEDEEADFVPPIARNQDFESIVDEITTEELPSMMGEPARPEVDDAVRAVADGAPEGGWTKGTIKAPGTAYTRLQALSQDLDDANPLDVLGMPPGLVPTLEEIGDAYDLCALVFSRERWLAAGPDAVKLAAHCRHVVREAFHQLASERAIAEAHVARSRE